MLLTISICVTSLQRTGLVIFYVCDRRRRILFEFELVQYLVITNNLLACFKCQCCGHGIMHTIPQLILATLLCPPDIESSSGIEVKSTIA